MAEANSFGGDLFVKGTLRATAVSLPASCVTDANVSGSSPITSPKLKHRHAANDAQAHGTASAARRAVLRAAHGAGSVAAVRAGVTVACSGGATITTDVKKNGTSILSAPIVLDNTNTAFALEAGTVTDADYVAGDVFEVVTTVSAGGGTIGQGAFVDVIFDEAAG